MHRTTYDAVIIGSGPNGLAAAIALQQQGLSTLILEAKNTIGGGMRTMELTLPGFHHDVCSAVHPLAVSSPFFSTLPLERFGLKYLYPEINAAHPLPGQPAVAHYTDIRKTARLLGEDGARYIALFEELSRDWPDLLPHILGPLNLSGNLVKLTRFGLKALQPASMFARRFQTKAAKALFAGMAAHSIQPLSNPATTAFGLVLMTSGHLSGWPVPAGGSQSIASALEGYYHSIGGEIVTGFEVKTLSQLPSSRAVLFDTSPHQLLAIAGHRLSSIYKWQLERYRYGMGAFKIDWALDDNIPFQDETCRKAGTIHLGNTFEEIADAEQQTQAGIHPSNPYVLLAQQSVIDARRAPSGKHTAWAYCHVPNGSRQDMTEQIEAQVERVAPGFRDRIIGRHTMNTAQLEMYNANYAGGDINGGSIDIQQLFTRPALRSSPYRTSAKGLYICSASTPPGGGVHGMCGFHAAKRAAKDIFKLDIKLA